MRIFIVKFIPNNINEPCVIHRIAMPSYGDKYFYRHVESWNAFSTGKLKGPVVSGKENCGWSPNGLYYTQDCQEDEWLNKIINRIRYFQKLTNKSPEEIAESIERIDETKFPTVEHASLYEFFDYIGFDRKARKYLKKEG